MVKHVEPHRLSGLQVGKSGISGGTGKAVVCSKHLRIANKKEGMCSRDNALSTYTVSQITTHSATGIPGLMLINVISMLPPRWHACTNCSQWSLITG